MSRSQRRFSSAVLASAALLLPAGLAWACVGVVSLTSQSKTVQPGGTLTVTLREFATKVPVDIHLDSATGPILVTAPGPDSTMDSKFDVTVPIPANITTGEHFLVATQNHHDMNSGAPARTTFYVGTAPPAPAAPEARPVGLESGSGPSAASLVLIGLGAAVGGLLLAGAWSLLAARGGPRPEAEVVK